MEMRRCTALRLQTKFKDLETRFHLPENDDYTATGNICRDTTKPARDGEKASPDKEDIAAQGALHKEKETTIDIRIPFDAPLAASPLAVFGLEYSQCAVLREQGFSTEDYPGPLYNGHLHSIFGAVVRRSMRKVEMNYDREYVRSEFDGCTLALDWRYAKGVEVAPSKFTNSFHSQSCEGMEDINSAASRSPSVGTQEASTQNDVYYSNHTKTVRIPTHYENGSSEAHMKALPKQAKGVVVIVPGLCSDENTNYLQRYIVQASENGFHCVLIGTRGMGINPLDRPLITSAAFAHDVQSVIGCHLTEKYISERFGYLNPADDDGFDGLSNDEAVELWRESQEENNAPKPTNASKTDILTRRPLPLLLLGFSIGGCLSIRCLAEARHSTSVHAAIALCSPWDFLETANNFCRPINMKLYNSNFTERLVEYAMKHRDVLTEQHPDLSVRAHLKELFSDIESRKRKLSSVMEYDKHIVCPIYGFKDPHEYYSTSSAWLFMKDVKIPLMCVSAIDDPITGPPPHIKRWQRVCDSNPNIVFVSCPTGGHLGFVQGPIDELFEKPNFMETRIVKALTTAARQRLVGNIEYRKSKGRTSLQDSLQKPLKNPPQDDCETYMRFKGTRTYMQLLEAKGCESRRTGTEPTTERKGFWPQKAECSNNCVGSFEGIDISDEIGIFN